jgi:hypothetical protein
MTAMTINRNFFKWPKLLYFKPESVKFELYKHNEELFKFEKNYIYSHGCHLGYRTVLTDTILRGTHPGTIPARFGLIWFSGFRGEDLNAIFYQNKKGDEILIVHCCFSVSQNELKF